MTVAQREKIKKGFDIIPKFITPALLVVILWQGGQWYQSIKETTFDSVSDKVMTKKHVEESLSLLEIHDLRSHITNPDFHMSRKTKDSLYVLRHEYNDLLDKITVTNYQLKEQLRELNILVRIINSKM